MNSNNPEDTIHPTRITIPLRSACAANFNNLSIIGCTRKKFKAQSVIYHPDKQKPDASEKEIEEALEKMKLLNNLKEWVELLMGLPLAEKRKYSDTEPPIDECYREMFKPKTKVPTSILSCSSLECPNPDFLPNEEIYCGLCRTSMSCRRKECVYCEATSDTFLLNILCIMCVELNLYSSSLTYGICF